MDGRDQAAINQQTERDDDAGHVRDARRQRHRPSSAPIPVRLTTW